MHITRLQMLAALGHLVFADAPAAAGDTGSAPAGQTPGDAANGAQAAAQASQDDPDGDDDSDDDDNGSQADDPKLRAARDEAYTNRTKAREAEERATAATQERDELIRNLGKHLGLVTDDDEDANPDVEALSKTVAEEQARAADAHRELAIYKAAGKAGAAPEKLLDSRRFLDSIKDVDPTDGDAVAAAIKDAVASNPDLASRRERGASTADTASGPGGGSAPKAEVPLRDALGTRYGTK